MVVASVGGLVALACGVVTVTQATEVTLAILVIVTIGLWAAATARHMNRPPAGLGRDDGPRR
jgi:hypothetical protein